MPANKWSSDQERKKRQERNPRPRPLARVRRVVGVCELFSSDVDLVCPLCHLTIPAGTPHRCERKEG
jgi:hypothetical protein